MQKTALHTGHIQRSAKMIDFQGWNLPAQFGDPTEEYHSVRASAGLFDVSFLGRIEISGAGSEALLDKLFTRSVSKMSEGSALVGMFCNEQGNILDLSILYKLSAEQTGSRYLITTSPGATETILGWIAGCAASTVRIEDTTADTAQISLQGPRAEAVMEAVAGSGFKKLKQRYLREATIAGIKLMLSRTGYTGEKGFELFLPAGSAQQVWDVMLQSGKELGLVPCGMTCRDMLRIEAGYAQQGNEIDGTRIPLGSGLMRLVDLRSDFMGKEAIQLQKTAGPKVKLVGFELFDKGIPKTGGAIFSDSREIGIATSGAYSPHRRHDVGLGYVETRYAQPGLEIDVEVKDRELSAKIVELPFYRKK